MCVTCGCGDTDGATMTLHEVEHEHEHEHVHADGTRHTHSHARGIAGVPFRQDTLGPAHVHLHETLPVRESFQVHESLQVHETDSVQEAGLSVPGRDERTIQLEAQILGKNQLTAERNRGWLSAKNILALNLVSSPGAGKTTLLERTLTDLKAELPISVVEGDQATSNDAERIRATGVPAVQINTGTGCHLDADMLERALAALKPPSASLLMIENVGNLVCPALFDLGERAKVVIFSVTEGEDKPLKYPHMFAAARVLLLSKTDLVPHLRFDTERALANALAVNRRLEVFRLSAFSGEGLPQWYGWLKSEFAACRGAPP